MTPNDRFDEEAREQELAAREDTPSASPGPEEGQVRQSSIEDRETEAKPGSTGIVQQFWRRWKEEGARSKQTDAMPRGYNNMDRSKAFLVLATAVVLCGFAFLALFSTSNSEKRKQERRTTPNLGRPAAAAQAGGPAGSTVPLLSADQAAGDQNGDQLSPEDINATSRRSPTAIQPATDPAANQYALSQIPPVNDPTLDAYRQQMNRYVPPPPPPANPTPTPAPPPPPVSTVDTLGKPSLVFVRSAATGVQGSLRSPLQPTVSQRNRPSALLPTGIKLVARLQASISSAVKTPVIAVIEYNYERDGQIVVPAGTKAIGELTQANQNGDVGLRFTSLELPDGTTEPIEGNGLSLDHGPLKGVVNGRNGAKRALVRSLTGIGSMAAYLVGGRSYGGLSGPIDQSILLRERIASNVGLAGEQELMRLAYTQNIVITLPGNTRFYIVLQETATTTNRLEATPAGASQSNANLAGLDGQALPTAAELRELVALKNELNRMYREVSATRSTEPLATPQQ